MAEVQQKNSEMIKSMVHGKPSRRHSSQSAIYDVFTWGQPKQQQKNANIIQKQPQYFHHQCCDPEQQPQHHHPQIISQYQDNYQTVPHNHQRQLNNHPSSPTSPLSPTEQFLKQKHHLKPHQIKNSLYIYDNIKMKKEPEKIENFDIKRKSMSVVKQQKLNERDQKDKKIIQMRKQKIKQFGYLTRDLPNSAFTTYYGRPAFESYGRCNSSSQLKTHNVMPHKGENHPNVKQTYQGALLKGRTIKPSDHLPRKPIQQLNKNTEKKKQSEIIHLPLEKPDLVNHVRFSQAKPSSRKEAVPSYESLRKQMKKSKKAETPRSQKNKKGKQKTSQSVTEDEDGLKFMNTRQHLIDLIEAKKVKDSRIAYKVTECYPPHALERSKTESDCPEQDRPAGIPYEQGDRAYNVIYRKY